MKPKDPLCDKCLAASRHARETNMAEKDTNVIISIDGRSWRFPGAHIDGDLWEGEWGDDGKLRLHDDAGKVVEGRELGEAEQISGEMLLADVLELAAAKLRSRQGWQESTTIDVFNEILHVYPSHVKKTLALLSGRF